MKRRGISSQFKVPAPNSSILLQANLLVEEEVVTTIATIVETEVVAPIVVRVPKLEKHQECKKEKLASG